MTSSTGNVGVFVFTPDLSPVVVADKVFLAELTYEAARQLAMLFLFILEGFDEKVFYGLRLQHVFLGLRFRRS